MFKDRIKELRTSNNLSVTEFGKAIGVSKTSASLYESGKQNPGPKTIKRICKTFGVDKEWLLGEDESAASAENDPKKQSKKKSSKKKMKEETVQSAAEVKSEPVIVESETAEELQETVEEREAVEAVPETKEPEVVKSTAEEPKAEPEKKPAKKGKTSKEKKEEPLKEEAASNVKGEKKMSKKNKYYGFVPPMPFAPYKGAWKSTENQEGSKEADKKKEDYKEMLKKTWSQKNDIRKSSAETRKNALNQHFEQLKEMQETYVASLPDDSFELPFAPNYSISPKKVMKRLQEFQAMANSHLLEQADIFNDFCIQSRQQFYDMVTSAMDNAGAKDSEASDK